jgi:hypothetical protein
MKIEEEFAVDFATIEWVNNRFPNIPKEQLLKSELPNGETMHWFAWECGSVRVILIAVVGVKGGLREEVFVVDNARKVFVDRLVLAETTTMGEGHILMMERMRLSRKYGGDPHKIAIKFLKDALEDFRERPEFQHGRYSRMSRPASASVRVVQGGSPGLRKRG